jgi:manganese catalase
MLGLQTGRARIVPYTLAERRGIAPSRDACLLAMKEDEEKEDALADLALSGAAQRVEHYEITGYTTAKNLAQQLRHSAIVALLAKSLAEEENAGMLLNQISRSLMSVAKMPDAIEQTAEQE